MSSIGEKFTSWILNDVKIEEYVKTAIIKGKEIDALKTEGKIENIENEFKIISKITNVPIPKNILDYLKGIKEVEIVKQEKETNLKVPEGIMNSVLEQVNSKYSDKLVLKLPHILNYEQIRSVSEEVWRRVKKLVFIISPSVEVGGRIVTNHNTYENIELVSGFSKETEDGTVHNINMIGDMGSRTKGQKCKSTLNMRLHKYSFISDDFINYTIFSEQKLDLGRCILVGIQIPIHDRRRIGEEAKNRTVIDLLIVSEHKPFILDVSKDQVLEFRKFYNCHDDLAKKMFGEMRHPVWFEKLIFCVNVTNNNYSYPAHLLFIGPAGSGKCHSKGTKIIMSDGNIKKVEDIKEGESLMGDDSTPRKVLSTTKGKEKLYEIIQKNGESYGINESHILSLRVSNNLNNEYKKNQIIDIPLLDYLSKNKYVQIGMKGYKVPVNFKEKEITIDPYYLGIWLADGYKRTTSICNPEKKIINYIKKYAKKLNQEFSIHVDKRNNNSNAYNIVNLNNDKNSLINKFKKYDLINNKHIPFDYKTNNKKVRMELLAGLLDGDGYSHNGCFEIIQKRKILSEDIVYLARSLGFMVSIKKIKKGIKKIGFVGEYYRIYISGYTGTIPIKLERKKCNKRKMNKNPLNTGIIVKEKGIGEYYGFELSGNGRYLLGDFTVTHNTRGLLRPLELCFDEVAGIVSGTSTIKGLIPSFKESPPQIGHLCRAEKISLVDEMFSFIKTSMKNGEQNNLGILKDVLDHENKSYTSGNGTINTVMNSVMIAVTNEDKFNDLTSVSSICDKIDRPFLSRLLIYRQTEQHIEFINNRKDLVDELEDKAYPVLDQKFISMFTWLKNYKIKGYDSSISKKIFNTYLGIIPGVTREVYQGRYRHHLKCIIAGMCKYRWLLGEKVELVFDKEDYKLGEEVFSNIISSWIDNDNSIQKLPVRARLSRVGVKEKIVYDFMEKQKISVNEVNKLLDYLEFTKTELEYAVVKLLRWEIIKVNVINQEEFYVPFWYGENR